MRSWSLTDEVALVTGGSGGIGTAVAAGLLDAGARVAIAGRREGALRAAAERLDAGDDQLLAAPVDVADAAAVQRLVEQVLDRFGSLGILVHLAADPGPMGVPSWEIDPADWRRSVEVNLLGGFHATRCALEPMLDQDRGTIVHVSSTAIEQPFPGAGPYGCAKAGIRHLIETLALELDGTGVRVHGVNPGPADTPTFHRVRSALAPDRRHWPGPLARRAPDEAARVILWLCSPAGERAERFVSWRDPQLRRRLERFALAADDGAAPG